MPQCNGPLEDYVVDPQKLAALYARIHSCHICPEMDNEKALRREDAVTFGTDTFLISQALAATQLRKSGVNFFDLQGELGGTGRKMELFLNRFGRTVYPYREVKLPSGATIPRCKEGYLPVYNTEITQCFPGRKRSGQGDRKPKVGEIRNCIGQNFIKEELEIIRPKLLLLMSSVSREAFYEHVLGKLSANTMKEDIYSIERSRALPIIEIRGLKISMLPIPHASARDGSFQQMLGNQRLINIIRRTLGINVED